MKEDESRQSVTFRHQFQAPPTAGVRRDIMWLCAERCWLSRLRSNTTPALKIKCIILYSSHIQYLSIFFWVFRVEFEAMSRMYISGSLIHHFGHSLTYNFLCRILQIKSHCMQEYHTIKFREIPERLGEGKKSENYNPASKWKSRPVGINSTLPSLQMDNVPSNTYFFKLSFCDAGPSLF